MTTAEHAFEITQLDFDYPARNGSEKLGIYRDFSASIRLGQTTVVMGASGSGKSTLGRIVAGLSTPQKGRVEKASRFGSPRDVVYIDQNAWDGVFPWLRVFDNICQPLRILGWKSDEIERRSEFLLATFRLKHRASAFPKELSGGELQRLAIARSLSWHPRAAILDESLSALDHSTKAQVIDSLRAVVEKDGTTLVLITHNAIDALAIGERVFVLAGRPVEVAGDLEIPLSYPRDPLASDYELLERELSHTLRSANS